MPTRDAVDGLLAQVRDWWQARGATSNMDHGDFERIANDLNMSVSDLETLVEKGPHAADFLYERMRALGLTQADVQKAAGGLMQDLQKTCSCCQDKGICEKDLIVDASDPSWKRYCPNAVTLESLVKLKHPKSA